MGRPMREGPYPYYTAIARTVAPATQRFAGIAAIYDREASPVPESVVDGWLQFLRIVEYAASDLPKWEVSLD